jgi:serine/threonine protein kinase
MRVFDDGVLPGGSPFIIAEYLPHTLDKAVGAGNLTTAEKACYILQLLSALSYLAALDPPVIHRDIKPQNIFVKGHSCVLGDFGLLKHETAESMNDQRTLKESLGVGMPFGYRTPDLVEYLKNGVHPTCKSDVYQLGLVAAELFTGKNPQRPAKRFNSRIALDPLRTIPGTEMADVISDLIGKMLVEDANRREPALRFLEAWQGVFLDAARSTHALEGRVF